MPPILRKDAGTGYPKGDELDRGALVWVIRNESFKRK